MLATAALVQPGCRPADDHPALVTFGSTVGKIYSWGFPAYVDPQMLEPLKPGGTGRLVDWRNLYYLTDPIGGPATGNPPRPDGAVDRVLARPATLLVGLHAGSAYAPGAFRLLAGPSRVDASQ